MQPARNTLRQIYANSVRHFAADQAPVVVWPLVCGSQVAQKTSALSCVNGELAVRVPDKAWKSQLQLFTNQYLAGLNELSRQKVKSIRFVAGV